MTENLKKEIRELSPEDMERVAGGGFLKNVGIFALNRLIDVGNILCFVVFPGGSVGEHLEYED